jgi:phenylpyruvate tautomerase PptA (4-oxalocrotonate tautomerase family)
MPIIVCECRTGLSADVKSRIANDITDTVRAVILSPLDLISVVFHDLPAESTYRSGVPTEDTLIFCHIREGRSDAAVLALAKGVSAVWSKHAAVAQEHIEVAVQVYPARYVVRGGERLPDAPRV